MNPNPAQTAATTLWQAWQQERSLDALPDDCRPQSIAEGYAVQAALAECSGLTLAGWKIAATSAAGQAHIAVDGPIAGRLFAQRIGRHPATVSLGAGNVMCVAEAEFAFRIGQDLTPRDRPYTQEEVMAHIAALHPAIEIPNSRFADFASVGGAQLVADDACAHRFVWGDEVTADWRSVDLAQYPVVLHINDDVATRGHGADALGDPRIALTWIANNHALQGDYLKAGQIITTGVCGRPSPIQAGDRVVAEFGEFGRVEVTITE